MEKIIEYLKNGVNKEEFIKLFSDYHIFEFDALFDILSFQGLPLIIKDDKVFLKTSITNYQDSEYCVVDIEVNNSKPKEGQVIEIGAVKIKNMQIKETFDALIYAKDVPIYVERVTGINKSMLKNKKSQKEILKEFRLFLKDSVFVAHAADFDFNFLDYQFEKENLGRLLNRHLCTITLSQKTIKAQRYGLKYLKEELNLPKEIDHRALSDALTTARLFLIGVKNLPDNIITTEDLIEFAKPNKSKKKKKKSNG